MKVGGNANATEAVAASNTANNETRYLTIHLSKKIGGL